MSAARDNEIGRCRCPVCSSDRARLRVSAKQLAYITCDSCNLQAFARSDRSDEKLRALLIGEPEKLPAEPLASDQKLQPNAASSMSWGVLGNAA